MYEGDAPLLDRRAQALALDRDLLRELLGAEELRELLDADALAELELELQALTDERAAGSADAVHDLLRGSATCRRDEVAARVRGQRRAGARARRRGVARGAGGRPARRPGADRRRGALDRDRGRRALPRRGRRRRRRRRAGGVPAPRRRDALGGCSRAGRAATARSWPPSPAARWGLPVGVVEAALERLMAAGVAAARRVPARRRRARVVRPGGAAPAAAPLAGPAAPRDRAGRRRALRASCRLAGHRRRARRHRPAGRGHRPARGPAAAGERPRARHPARPRARLPAAAARRARRGRRGLLGRAGRLGRDDGRIALYRPDRLALLVAELAADSRRMPDAAAGDRVAARRPAGAASRPTWRHLLSRPARRPPPRPRGTSGAPVPASASCSTRSGTWSGRAT